MEHLSMHIPPVYRETWRNCLYTARATRVAIPPKYSDIVVVMIYHNSSMAYLIDTVHEVLKEHKEIDPVFEPFFKLFEKHHGS